MFGASNWAAVAASEPVLGSRHSAEVLSHWHVDGSLLIPTQTPEAPCCSLVERRFAFWRCCAVKQHPTAALYCATSAASPCLLLHTSTRHVHCCVPVASSVSRYCPRQPSREQRRALHLFWLALWRSRLISCCQWKHRGRWRLWHLNLGLGVGRSRPQMLRRAA